MQQTFYVKTSGRSFIDITNTINEIIAKESINIGLCNVFLHHTSASLTLAENYDTSVRDDLESFMQALAPDGDPSYTHTAEGPDDMPSHIRSVLTQNSITIPITQNKLALGTWQGIYLWEHRFAPNNRKITLTIQNAGVF